MERIWMALDENEVWRWAKDYGLKPPSVNPGAWSVSIKNRSKAVKSSGTNVYPNYIGVVSEPCDSPAMLHRLWYAVDKLLGRGIEVNGTYLADFEVSRFCPSGEEFKGQRWWLTSTKEFNEQYQKLSGKNDGQDFQFVGPEVFARLRGRLVGPGHYGHLNDYTHEFIVDEVLEMKMAK